MLLGSSTSAIAAVHTLDTRHHHDQRQPSLAAARSVVSSAPMTHYFHSIKAIDTFPDAHRAVALLDRLRSDWGVRAAMLKRGWHVHVLSELHPAQASILGYNRNKGHEISLRLRTDRLDGFRMYSSLRDVLIHELAHMTHSEHNSQFHALNRELTKEIAATNSGTDLNERHTAIYHGPSDPKLQSESILSASGDKLLQGGVHRLGGGQLAVANEAAPDGHTSRQVLAAAALLRLTAKEEHITGGCSTSD
ncbi:hypothetical protein BSLG_004782 [Batrachochytrium salamandrivorans]|nr:hypothetical protein BSLG_004782 [Batrachochytrium salamandrivorans]